MRIAARCRRANDRGVPVRSVLMEVENTSGQASYEDRDTSGNQHPVLVRTRVPGRRGSQARVEPCTERFRLRCLRGRDGRASKVSKDLSCWPGSRAGGRVLLRVVLYFVVFFGGNRCDRGRLNLSHD